LNITCSTLVVRGEHGLDVEDAERFVGLLRDGRWTTVADAGHNVQSDNPVELTRAIVSFLDECRLRATSDVRSERNRGA